MIKWRLRLASGVQRVNTDFHISISSISNDLGRIFKPINSYLIFTAFYLELRNFGTTVIVVRAMIYLVNSGIDKLIEMFDLKYFAVAEYNQLPSTRLISSN